MIIGVDNDEVLASLLESYLVNYNVRHGTHFKRADFPAYRWWETFRCGKDEAYEEYFAFMKTAESRGIIPIPGSIEGIAALSGDHELVVITSRQIELRPQTEEWLNVNYNGRFSGVYFGNEYGGSRKAVSKAEICSDIGAELLIDDQIEHAEDCAARGMRVLLLDSPWNQNGSLPKGVERVYSWEEIVEKV